MNKWNSLFLGVNILIAISLVTGASLYASFSDTSSAPPNDNTSAPINTSATTQVKQGVLVSNAEVQAPVFRSSQKGGYYVHPVGSWTGWSGMWPHGPGTGRNEDKCRILIY